MRLAYVCTDPGIPVFGAKGASVHVQELLRAYRRLGHEVILVAARVEGTPPADLEDVEVVELGRARGADTARRELAAMAVDERAERVLAGIDGLALVHERYSLWGGAGIRVATNRGVPGVLEVNAPLIDEQATHRELVHRQLATQRLLATVRQATTVTAVSEPVADWVRAHAPEVADAVHVIANGVDTDRIRPAEAGGRRPFTVGFVGNLRPWHGVETLIDAVAQLRTRVPDARILLVGDGKARTELEAAAETAGVPLTCTGALRPADVPAQLHRMDVACAPYPAGDAAAYFSPLKVLEYLAAGVAVVASDTGQLPELLDHGRCGVLVAPGDAAALAAGLGVLAADPSRRAELGRAGRAKVVEHHRWRDVAARTLQLAHQPHRVPAGVSP
jgi:glycosyltransferase involved in cell wall biosynthesis